MSRLIVVSNRVNPPTGAGEESVGGLAMALVGQCFANIPACGSAGAARPCRCSLAPSIPRPWTG